MLDQTSPEIKTSFSEPARAQVPASADPDGAVALARRLLKEAKRGYGKLARVPPWRYGRLPRRLELWQRARLSRSRRKNQQAISAALAVLRTCRRAEARR